jgi:hypothetical protein
LLSRQPTSRQPRRDAHAFLSFRLATLACLGIAGMGVLAALAPAAGCNGTGTTPMCDFPDGANNPEAGCGVLIEASADGLAAEDAPVTEDVTTPPQPDAQSGVDAQAAAPDARADASPDASDAHITDASADASKG